MAKAVLRLCKDAVAVPCCGDTVDGDTYPDLPYDLHERERAQAVQGGLDGGVLRLGA